MHDEFTERLQGKVQLSVNHQSLRMEEFVAERKSRQEPTNLVLGARNLESDRFGPGWIYINSDTHDPDGVPHLTVDFNSLEDLNRVSRIVGSNLAQIAMDANTYFYNEWTFDHLLALTSMLKDDGNFVFSLYSFSWSTYPGEFITSLEMAQEMKVTDKYVTSKDDWHSEVFPSSAAHPIVSVRVEEESIDLEYRKVMALKDLPEYQELIPYMTEYAENKKPDPASQEKVKKFRKKYGFHPGVLFRNEEARIREDIRRDLQQPEISKITELLRNRIEREGLVPYVKRVLHHLFGKVDVLENAPLPFPNNWRKLEKFVFTAKFPKQKGTEARKE